LSLATCSTAFTSKEVMPAFFVVALSGSDLGEIRTATHFTHRSVHSLYMLMFDSNTQALRLMNVST
jgi:hypothetical protein